MAKVIGIFLFLVVSVYADAQQSHTKALLQGTWYLTNTHTELEWHFEGRNKCTIDVSEDSLLILVFKNDTMLKITPWRYQAPDTILYLWEIKNDLIYFWLPNVKRKKQLKKYMFIDDLTNFKLKIWESLDDHSSVINSSIHLDLTFTKENKEEAYLLQKRYFGEWFITDKSIKNMEDLTNSPLIKLHRNTHYIDTTTRLNPCKDITHKYLDSRLLIISDIGKAGIDYRSDTIALTPPPCSPSHSIYESWIYPKGRSIDHSATVIIFYKSRQLRLTLTDSTSSLFKFERVGDHLILIKQEN
jgi:hypothetical protein